jgi:hypothetical protein
VAPLRLFWGEQQATGTFVSVVCISFQNGVDRPRSAAEQPSAIMPAMHVARFASAAESAAAAAESNILEVQGQRIHLFKNTGSTGEVDLAAIYDACRVFHQIATREIRKFVVQTGFSIRMAADHGRTILLKSSGMDEGFWIGVVVIDIELDGFDEIGNALKGSASNAFSSDFSKPTLELLDEMLVA